MAIDFPPTPTVGYIYTYEGRSWQWNGIAWVKAFDGEYKRGEWRLDL